MPAGLTQLHLTAAAMTEALQERVSIHFAFRKLANGSWQIRFRIGMHSHDQLT